MHFLKQKMPHYVALNHIAALLCHNCRSDILKVQGEVIFIEILWKQKSKVGRVFRWSVFTEVDRMQDLELRQTRHDIAHFLASPMT